MRNRLAIIAATALLTTGCVNALAGAIGESIGYPMDDKTVSSKMEPNVLVAVDGSWCEVSNERWEKAKEGDFVLCKWQAKSAASSSTAR
jgi:hypothetical protein